MDVNQADPDPHALAGEEEIALSNRVEDCAEQVACSPTGGTLGICAAKLGETGTVPGWCGIFHKEDNR